MPPAGYLNALPKIVLSTTLSEVEWSNAQVSNRAVEDEIPGLKRRPGKDTRVLDAPDVTHLRHRVHRPSAGRSTP